MKFKNIKQAEDGMQFDVEASNQEITWLVNYAVETLMKEGVISVMQYAEEQEVELRGVSH